MILILGAIINIAPRYKYTFRLAEVAGRIRYAAGENTGLGPAPAVAADGGGYPPTANANYYYVWGYPPRSTNHRNGSYESTKIHLMLVDRWSWPKLRVVCYV